MTTTTTAKQEAPATPSLFEMVQQAERDSSESEAREAAKQEDAAGDSADESSVETDDSADDTPVADDAPADPTASDQEPVGDDEQGRSTGSTEASIAHKFLEMLGYDVDGVSEEELIAEAKRRFEPAPQPAARPSKPDIEPKADILSATPKEGAKPEASEPKRDLTKQEESKRISKLYCDPRFEALVDYNKAGKAIAREDAGEEGAAAAKQVNEYLKSYRERMQRLGEDPIGFLEQGGLQELIQKEIQAGIQKLESERTQQAAEATKQQQQQAEQQNVQEFFAKHEQEIYSVGKDGKPRFVGGGKQLSEFGKAVEAEYESLRVLAPSAMDSALLKAAYERAQKVSGVAKAEPPKPVKEVAAEKKKRFLDKRTTPPRQETTASPPTVNEQAGRVSLRDLVLADALNDDNPEVLKLRGSAR